MKIMRKLNLYISIMILLLVTSCREEFVERGKIDLQQDEYLLNVSIPEASTVVSRVLDEPSQSALQNLPLSVLVFDENGFFLSMRKADPVTVNGDGKSGTFKVSLPPSDTKRILHFVLGNVEYPKEYDRSDSESSVFGSLTVKDGVDAYWQRIEVDKIQQNETSFEQPIKLIRNFAKISLTVNDGVNDFELLGFIIINETNEGTVAPYTGNDGANGRFATFDLEQDVKPYESFTRLNKGYGGNALGERIGEYDEKDFSDSNPKYVYECNQDKSDNPAYILLKANYAGKDYYYKLDIVTTDTETFVTSYLNLYRNFHYSVTINKVNGAGYSTPDAAMAAAASNNLSASVEVSEVNEIEDGLGNKLWVSDVDIMLVTTDIYSIKYEYTINNGENANGQVKVSTVGDLNTQAISKFENDQNGNLIIYPATNLPSLMERQEFILATPSGLARRVTVYVRKPFEFSAVDCDNYVAEEVGSELTLVVRLPENMPTAVFPLTLDIEPVKKSIYPDTKKNRIPVEAEGTTTFNYAATVTYNDYRKNPAFFFHFKTNMAKSATQIKVTNPYFLDSNNTAEFNNTSSSEIFGFLDLKLSSDGNGTFSANDNIFTFNTYNTGNKPLTMTFRLHDEGDKVTTSEHVIEIYGRYLDFANEGNNVVTETGTFTVREDNHCILYVPNDIYAEQKLTFTITQNYASETLQLSSLDHKTATVDYKMPSKRLQLKYSTRRGEYPISNATVSIYKDESYSEKIMDKETDGNGYITIESFAGFSEGDQWVFRYRDYWSTYSVSVTVGELTKTTSDQLLILTK